MATFRAIEVERASRRPTGRRHELEASTRDEAIAALLSELGVDATSARIDPTRTMVDLGPSLWTIVGIAATSVTESPGLRRAAAKHRRVR